MTERGWTTDVLISIPPRKVPALNSAATPASVQFGSVNLTTASAVITRTTARAQATRALCAARLVMCGGVAVSPR